MSGPDLLNVVRKFLGKEDTSVTLNFSSWSPRAVWHAVREEPGHFRYAVWIKSAFFISVIVLLFNAIRTLSVIASLVDLYKNNRQKFRDHFSCFDNCLEEAGWSDGFDSVTKTVAVEFYLLIDAIILDFDHIMYVGYTLGVFVGLWSLVAVLIQHKRMSLAVAEGLHQFRAEALAQGQQIESPWPAFQKKYPILQACFFLAILSSTAVIQLQIVGFVVNVVLGLIVNVAKLGVLMDIFGFYILAYVLVLCVDIFVMYFLKTWLITWDGAHIRHPRWFNFTMVVLSMVHLVIGLLYALWRILLLLITTVIVLNRLDVTLFTAGKGQDFGHKAFMSMLVLTVLIQEDHESFAVKTSNRSKNSGV